MYYTYIEVISLFSYAEVAEYDIEQLFHVHSARDPAQLHRRQPTCMRIYKYINIEEVLLAH